MGFGIAILALFGVGLLASAFDSDDDSSTSSETDTDTNMDTDAAQTINASDAAETIATGSGNDVVRTQGGADLVSTGDGNDRAFGGTENDLMFGDNGNDLLRGEQGADNLFGGAGNDTLFGDTGNDTLYGIDVIDEADTFNDAAATNFFLFDQTAAFDPDSDPQEADTLNGGTGNDVIFAGSNDVVDTGTGNDSVVVGDWVDPGAPAVINGFDVSTDALAYSFAPGDATPLLVVAPDADGVVSLYANNTLVATLPNLTADQAGDVDVFAAERTDTKLFDVEVGTDQDDILRGGENDDIVLANDGDDRVFGNEGDDLVFGDAGNDFLRGGAQDDLLQGGEGTDTLNGDTGEDFLIGDTFIDFRSNLSGFLSSAFSGGDDLSTSDLVDLNGDTGSVDVLNGGFGEDVLFLGSNDVASGGDDIDFFVLGDWMDPTQPATITDLTADEEISFLFSPTDASDPGPTLTITDEGGGDAALRVDGTIYAVLQGFDASTAQSENLSVQAI
ncbi:MAG: calcium-binding protein [Pseudomonadota bacterium]